MPGSAVEIERLRIHPPIRPQSSSALRTCWEVGCGVAGVVGPAMQLHRCELFVVEEGLDCEVEVHPVAGWFRGGSVR